MKLATTTADFTSYGVSYEESIRLIHDAGFRYIDISVETSLINEQTWQEDFKRLREYAESLDMQFVQAHSPDIGNAMDPAIRPHYLESTKRSIEICGILGVPHTVVHSGYKPTLSKEEVFQAKRDFFHELLPDMERNQVCCLVENTTRKNLDLPNGFYTGADMVEFLQYANNPMLHAVWDTGHGNPEGTQYEQLLALGDELYGLHVHDNSGRGDEHSYPFLGTMNMDDLMNGLIDCNYKGYFTFEAIDLFRNANSRHGKRHVFERDQRLLNATLDMQIDAERLLYTIGKHCLSAYNLFEG